MKSLQATPFEPLGKLPEGTTLLEASAGTGKTYSITSIFLRLVIELDIQVDNILVVTFTNAATAELSTRIRKRLGEAYSALERLTAKKGGTTSEDEVVAHLLELAKNEPEHFAARARAAVENYDRAQVSTIHGFCQQILRQHALEANVPFGVEVSEEQSALIQEIATDFWAQELCRLEPFELQLLKLSGLDLKSVTSLVWTAISNLEAKPVPDIPAAARPDSKELVDALDEAARLAREPGADTLVRELLMRTNLKDSDIEKAIRALDPLGRRMPSEKDRVALGKILDGVRGRGRDQLAPMVVAIIRFIEAYDRWRPRGNAWALSVRRAAVDYARKEIDRRARALGQWSFDDMLRRVRDALNAGGEGHESPLQRVVGARFKAVLIDEFQDTDPVQWEIFERLFKTPHHRLYLIGDPKQAIYSFRRADVKTYIAARSQAQHIHDLSVNRRSDPPLIDALNALFTRKNPDRVFADDAIGYQVVKAPIDDKHPFEPIRDLGAPIRLLWVERNRRNTGSKRDDPGTSKMSDSAGEEELPRLVASDIVRTLEKRLYLPDKGRHASPADMAVLVPKNKQASEVQRALQDLGVPAVIHGPYSVFTTEDATELQIVLAAILEPSRLPLVRKALVTRLIGVTASELARMDRESPKELEAWIDLLRQWRDDWNGRSFIEGFRKLVSFRVKDLLTLVDGERRLANLLQLGEILHLTASQRGLKAPGLLAWFGRQLQEGREDDKNQVRLETDEPAVQIVTIHKAKGLEYPFVWCPYLWQPPQAPGGWFKTYEFVLRKRNETLLDVGIDPEDADRRNHASIKLYDLRTEQLRQLYVALTRAKHQVTLYGGAYWGLPSSALGYLLFGNGQAEDARTLEAEMKSIEKLSSVRDNDLMYRATKDLHPELVSAAVAGPVRKERAELQETTPILQARRFDQRGLDTDWRRTSFSGLAAELARVQSYDEEKVQAASDEDNTELDLFAAMTTQEVVLADLPSGRMIGNCIHKVFELLDFRDIDIDRVRPLVERELLHFGIDASHTDTLSRSVREVLTTPLDATGLTLSELGRDQRLAELDFVFPTRTDPGFSLSDLVHAFRTHGGPHLADWLEMLSAADFREVRGFMTGSIDLAFKSPRDQRWYVLDWKSNHLGRRAADYDVTSMRAAMDHHHYHLQYHLYTVAFARYLRHRVPGFDLERDLGGAYYLFVRGVSPDHPFRTGVYYDRPTPALVMALDEVFTAAAFGTDPSNRGAR